MHCRLPLAPTSHLNKMVPISHGGLHITVIAGTVKRERSSAVKSSRCYLVCHLLISSSSFLSFVEEKVRVMSSCIASAAEVMLAEELVACFGSARKTCDGLWWRIRGFMWSTKLFHSSIGMV